MASSSSHKEVQNFYRISSLLLDFGTASFRKLLLKYALKSTTSLDQHLQNNKAQLNQLLNKHILNQTQIDVLFPVNGKTDIETYDISLLSCLIRNTIKTIPQQVQQELDNVRTLRNDVCAHVPNTFIDDAQFKPLWVNIRKSITILAQGTGDATFVQDTHRRIHELETDPKLVPSSVRTERLLEWQKSDQLLSEQLEQHHEEVMSKFESLQKASTSLTEMVSKQNEEMVEMTNAFTENKLKLQQISDAIGRWSGIKDQCVTIVDQMQMLQEKFTGHSEATQESLKRIEENQEEVLAEIKGFKQAKFERLKRETKDAFQDLDEAQFISTAQFDAIEHKLDNDGIVYIMGGPADGKTTTGLRLLKKYASRGSTCLILKTAADFDNIGRDIIDCILIDDIFGSYTLDFDALKQWSGTFPQVESALAQKKLKIIVTSHGHIASQIEDYQFASNMKTFLFEHKLELSSGSLSAEEKTQMLKLYLTKHNKSVRGTALEDIVEHYSLRFGFPACCDFCLRNHDKEDVELFLEYPYEFILKILEKLTKSDHVALLLLFAFQSRLRQEQLNESKVNEKTFKTVSDISQLWCESTCRNLPGYKIRQILGYMRSIFTDFSNHVFYFANPLLYETVGLMLAQKDPDACIKHCNTEFLLKFFRIYHGTSSKDMLILVKEENCDALARRYVEESEDVSDLTLERLLCSKVFNNKLFVQKYFEWLKFKKSEEQVLRKVVCHAYLFGSLVNPMVHQYNPELLNLVTYNDKFEEQLVKCLRCHKCQNTSDDTKNGSCWKCDDVTPKALTYAFECELTSLFHSLLENTAAVKSSILLSARGHSNRDLLQALVTELIASGKWDQSDGPTLSARRQLCSDGSYEQWKILNKRIPVRNDLILKDLNCVVGECKLFLYDDGYLKCERNLIASDLSTQLQVDVLNEQERSSLVNLMGLCCRNFTPALLDSLMQTGVPVQVVSLRNVIDNFMRYSYLRFKTEERKHELRSRYRSLFTSVLNGLKEASDWHPRGEEVESIMESVFNIRDDNILPWTYHELVNAGFPVTVNILESLSSSFFKNENAYEEMVKDIVQRLKSSRDSFNFTTVIGRKFQNVLQSRDFSVGYLLADAGFLTSPGTLQSYISSLQTICIGFGYNNTTECPHKDIICRGVEILKCEGRWKPSDTRLGKLMQQVCQYSRYDLYKTLVNEDLPVSKECLYSLEQDQECSPSDETELIESDRKLFRIVNRAIVLLKPETKTKQDFSGCIAEASKRGRADLFDMLVKDIDCLDENFVIEAVNECCTCKKPLWFVTRDKQKDKEKIVDDIRQKLTDIGEWDKEGENV